MESSVDTAIREALRRYVGGKITIDEFQDWFVPQSWNIHQRADPSTVDLAYEIDLRLAEYSNGDRTEDELKRILRPLIRTVTGRLSSKATN